MVPFTAREIKSNVPTELFRVKSDILRPTKRHDSAAVLREESGQLSLSVLERRPLQASASTQ